MQIDVVLLTKNSFKPCLKECLESIRDNIPVNMLIIVDGGSTDENIPFISDFCRRKNIKFLLIDDKFGNRATSRQKGIDQVETEWFAFVDSDCILCKGWFNKAEKLISRDEVLYGVSRYPSRSVHSISRRR